MKTLVKPSPDFPLTAGKNGYWVKVVKGKQHRIGARWASPDEAIVEWLRVRDQLLAGEDPTPDPNALQLRDAMNWFLSSCKSKVETGDISEQSYVDYVRECRRAVEVLGKSKVVASLVPTDFAKLRSAITSPSPNTVRNRITRIKVAFAWLNNSGLIDKPIKFGPAFNKPSAKTIRLHRASKPKKLFKSADLRTLVACVLPEMRAMVLLGVNAGYGNTDCSLLPWSAIDSEWIDYPRPKTGINRRAWLWPETLEALKQLPGDGDLVFPGYSYYRISLEFGKVAKAAGIGLTFYALRHTFQTIAGQCKDPLAVSAVMGHLIPGMAGIYTEEIGDDRLRVACETVRDWYLK